LSRAHDAPVSPAIVSAILVDVLDGLHAAHEARNEHDEPLEIVHRDVSPQNIIVGSDGAARVLDFGIAKATTRVQSTRDGEVKGKFPYMAPEQMTRQKVDQRADVFSSAVVLWEALTGRRLFHAENPAAVVARVMNETCAAPSSLVPGLSPELDTVVLTGLSRDRDMRYLSASDFARALEKALPPARRSEVREWVLATAHDILTERARRVAAIEHGSASQQEPSPTPEVLTTPGGPSAAAVTLPRPDDEPAHAARRASHHPRVWFGYAGGIGLIFSVVILAALRHTAAQADASASAPVPMAESSVPPAAPPEVPEIVAAPAGVREAIVRPAVSAPRGASGRVPVGRPQNVCDPPYTFNDAGVKRWKRACL
jgi:eukaryotic-like serine/threonine-protein kinase